MSRQKLQLAVAILAIATLSFAAGTIAQPRYPEIVQAEGSLQTALAQLRVARDVFGGHKVNAERLINQAINELETGKGFAAAHGY